MKNYRVVFQHVVPALMYSDPFIVTAESEEEVRKALEVVGRTLQDFEIVELEELEELPDGYQVPMPIGDDEEETPTGDNVIQLFDKNKLN